MLAILIPIYNFDIRALVRNLHQQATDCSIPFEILCYDDDSLPGFKNKNRSIGDLEHVTYLELNENAGRSKIRNMLAEAAQYEQLLFMDCDSKTASSHYIRTYIEHLGEHLVYGGRVYEANPPEDPSEYLRWYYGTQREMIDCKTRQMNPYKHFMTNNFVIPRKVYLNIKLDESLIGYGHEDTLFGLELKRQNIRIRHIDNPLYHIGLEGAGEFLEKTKEGVSNLLRLIQQGQLSKDIKIYRYYKRIKKLGMRGAILKSFLKNEHKVIANLMSDQPNLKRFDFYKLGYLLALDDKTDKPKEKGRNRIRIGKSKPNRG